MSEQTRPAIKSPTGLTVNFHGNGLIERIVAGPIRLNLNNKSPLGIPGINLYLRKKTAVSEYTALLGPESNCRFGVVDNAFIAKGRWGELDYVCTLQLSEKGFGWQWSTMICNRSEISVELDLIYVQDAGLAPSASGRTNEYYVSQYLERRILQDDQYGAVICCRQNLEGPTGHPFLMLASKNRALSASVDGMQFYGHTFRATGIPEGLLASGLAGEYSGELSVLALQETPFTLAANSTHQSTFVASYVPDHAQATSLEDLLQLPALMQSFEGMKNNMTVEMLSTAEKNLFLSSPLLLAEDLTSSELDGFFSGDKRHVETIDGQLLSFFYDANNHVVLRAKEMTVDRPHAHIMQARSAFVPDENIMTTTSYMYGVFNSHLTQGNTNFNRLLSACSSQFNLDSQTGQRLFVEIENRLLLLGVPSAFEIGLNHCRWIYKYGDHCFQVRTWTSKASPQINMDFKVLRGNAVNLRVSHQFDEDNGWEIGYGQSDRELIARPVAGSLIAKTFPRAQFRILINGTADDYKFCGDDALYFDRRTRGDAFLVVEANETSGFCMSFVGEVIASTSTVVIDDADQQWASDCQDAQSAWQELCSNLTLHGEHEDLAVIRETLPWYGVNALTHFLTPHGLEQVNGAAWGTRDTAQGPFELLLSTRKFQQAKQVLRTMFSNQDSDAGWPQWWMFDSYSSVRSKEASGDIVLWCMLALSAYIKTTGDVSFLDEVLPYYHAEGIEAAEKTALSEHIDRLINRITASFFPGTSLIPLGGGDWNDSMQPASQALAARMLSTWTVELNYQAFAAYRAVCLQVGRHQQAASLGVICEGIKADFNKHLVKDGTVSGSGLIEEDGSISLLLHPSDNRTNIQYRLLSMIRGIISGIFTPEQAQHHRALIEQHLKGPDGARLMNRPPKYRGGIQTLYQRAESSPYFGREIGLMYMHAQLRYAESLAITGHADAFLKALRQATPVAYRDIVACGDLRQANCYYSSSDATFKNRYEAEEKYEDLKAGKITLKGGWRIYSSGPGIFIGLIYSRLLGLREAFGNMVIDPVIARSLNGMSASMTYKNRNVTFSYTVIEKGVGPKSISINDQTIEFTREENQYRMGGALIPADQFLRMLNKAQNTVAVQLH